MLGLNDDDITALAEALPGRIIATVSALDGTRYVVVGEEAPWYVTRLDGLYAVLDGQHGLLAEARTLEKALVLLVNHPVHCPHQLPADASHS